MPKNQSKIAPVASMFGWHISNAVSISIVTVIGIILFLALLPGIIVVFAVLFWDKVKKYLPHMTMAAIMFVGPPTSAWLLNMRLGAGLCLFTLFSLWIVFSALKRFLRK